MFSLIRPLNCVDNCLLAVHFLFYVLLTLSHIFSLLGAAKKPINSTMTYNQPYKVFKVNVLAKWLASVS